jgi:hypothetical protein
MQLEEFSARALVDGDDDRRACVSCAVRIDPLPIVNYAPYLESILKFSFGRNVREST